MKGYQCDRCEKWFEREPLSGAFHQYIPKGHLIGRITVVLHAYKEGSNNSLDLCGECTVSYLELIARTWRTSPVATRQT